jgi:hypothetical protein
LETASIVRGCHRYSANHSFYQSIWKPSPQRRKDKKFRPCYEFEKALKTLNKYH